MNEILKAIPNSEDEPQSCDCGEQMDSRDELNIVLSDGAVYLRDNFTLHYCQHCISQLADENDVSGDAIVAAIIDRDWDEARYAFVTKSQKPKRYIQ